ncbi:MAG: hypothetical protein IIW05_05645 [Paludibacteraceae bacterium]|nr:hypothetical protein [Paludibacteraceae bacterium]
MKLSLKLSSLAMAACASLYALSILIWQIPAVHSWAIWRSHIGYLPHVAVLIGMIIFGIGLYQQREQLPRLNKSLRWQAIGITIITACMLIYNCLFNGSVFINGMAYCYWESWSHIVILLWVAAWLLQFGLAKRENTYANPVLGVVGIIVSVAATLLLTFMLVSYVHVLVTGHVAGFQTTTWLSWLRPIALISLGGTMLLGDSSVIKEKEQTDNDGTEVHSYSRANQIIAKVSVGVIVSFIILGIMGGICCWLENTYFGDCYWMTVFGSIHMLWISSVIAMLLEKQLPKWQHTLNILAPLTINGIIVLSFLLSTYIPYEAMNHLRRTITEDVPMIFFILSIIFVIVVWLINTIVVLRSRVQSQQKQIDNIPPYNP